MESVLWKVIHLNFLVVCARDDFGTGIIVVTHNIGVAAYMADKLLVMRQGKVVDSGQREDILHNPQSEYTKNLLASVPALKGERYV